MRSGGCEYFIFLGEENKKALEKSRASAEESVKFQLRSGTRPEKMSFEADAVVI